MDVRPLKINPKSIKDAERDVHGNLLHDLAGDNLLSGKKVLVYMGFVGEGFSIEYFDKTIRPPLERKGFAVKVVSSQEDVIDALPGSDVAWIISFNSTQKTVPGFVEVIRPVSIL